mmetsp:Transcript_13912/g.52938  ORF Transcript_13912/g.52938 Transcript_13912/m.52938 type:complete len:522 (-) Transcript_13912:928-2493(-)
MQPSSASAIDAPSRPQWERHKEPAADNQGRAPGASPSPQPAAGAAGSLRSQLATAMDEASSRTVVATRNPQARTRAGVVDVRVAARIASWSSANAPGSRRTGGPRDTTAEGFAQAQASAASSTASLPLHHRPRMARTAAESGPSERSPDSSGTTMAGPRAAAPAFLSRPAPETPSDDAQLGRSGRGSLAAGKFAPPAGTEAGNMASRFAASPSAVEPSRLRDARALGGAHGEKAAPDTPSSKENGRDSAGLSSLTAAARAAAPALRRAHTGDRMAARAARTTCGAATRNADATVPGVNDFAAACQASFSWSPSSLPRAESPTNASGKRESRAIVHRSPSRAEERARAASAAATDDPSKPAQSALLHSAACEAAAPAAAGDGLVGSSQAPVARSHGPRAPVPSDVTSRHSESLPTARLSMSASRVRKSSIGAMRAAWARADTPNLLTGALGSLKTPPATRRLIGTATKGAAREPAAESTSRSAKDAAPRARRARAGAQLSLKVSSKASSAGLPCWAPPSLLP